VSKTPVNPPPPPSKPPIVTRPPTKPPNRAGHTDLLRLIDDQLIALLAVAYFGPAEQGAASSVDQVCAAEVLLFRLRAARLAVRDLCAAYELPARQDHASAAVGLNAIASTGGPGSGHLPTSGECLSPGYAAALCGAACESAGVAASAGAISGRGGKVASGAPRPGFLLPPTLPVPSFEGAQPQT
jgi:hypothetical protein